MEKYSKNSESEPKTVFESLLEKKVKGAEKLPDSVSLAGETPSANSLDWKGDCRYYWKYNFPHSSPKQDRIRRYIIIKKYVS